MYCHDTMDCFLLPGYTCQMGRCICDQERHTGLFSCIPARIHGDKCQDDLDCRTGDVNLVCTGLELRTCRCRRGLVWDIISKRCYRVDDDAYGGKFDPVRDLIIPGIIVMTIGAMMYLGIKLFCNCGKLWHRRRRQDTAQELTETHHHPGTWVTSYRVLGSLSGLEGGAGAINGSPGVVQTSSNHHHHHSTPPCVGLFVPNSNIPAAGAAAASTSIANHQAPPPYEEALKHKVVLSSYPNTTTIVTLLPSATAPPPPTTPSE